MVFGKLLQRDRRTTEQTRNGVRVARAAPTSERASPSSRRSGSQKGRPIRTARPRRAVRGRFHYDVSLRAFRGGRPSTRSRFCKQTLELYTLRDIALY